MMEQTRCIQTIKVVSSSGKPVSGATVTLITNDNVVNTVHVKSDGLWRMRLNRGGVYTVKAEYAGQKAAKTFTACTTADLVLTLGGR